MAVVHDFYDLRVALIYSYIIVLSFYLSARNLVFLYFMLIDQIFRFCSFWLAIILIEVDAFGLALMSADTALTNGMVVALTALKIRWLDWLFGESDSFSVLIWIPFGQGLDKF